MNVDAEDDVRNVIHPDVDKQGAEIKSARLVPKSANPGWGHLRGVRQEEAGELSLRFSSVLGREVRGEKNDT